jgi:ribosomal protein L10
MYVALNLEQKRAVVAEVNEIAASALSVVAAEYRGLTVEELTELRVKSLKRVCRLESLKTLWRVVLSMRPVSHA